MRRIALLLGGYVVAVAAAQQGVNWITDPTRAVQTAKQANRPIMAWVRDSSEDRADDLERDQKRAFQNPMVLKQMRRFVTLRLSQTVNRNVLPQFGFNERANMELSFVAPDGTVLDRMAGGMVANPEALASKLRQVFRAYGTKVYEADVKPVLAKEDAEPKVLKTALDQVGEFEMQVADKDVAALLDRETLPKNLRKDVIDTLTQLSTQVAVDKLLELARADDPLAEKALLRCTPAAAALMLAEVKPDAEPFDYLVYSTAGKICRVPKILPVKVMEKFTVDKRTQEVERVKKTVDEVAARWKAENE